MFILSGTTGLPLPSTKPFSKLRAVLARSAENPPQSLPEVLQLTTIIGAAWYEGFSARGVTGASNTSTTTPTTTGEPPNT